MEVLLKVDKVKVEHNSSNVDNLVSLEHADA